MECMLLPKDPTAPLTKVPYVATQRYDGGEWFSYPERIDPTRPQMIPEEPLTMHQHLKRMPIAELESFLQTWLFFGLLSEFFCGNALAEEEHSQPEDNLSVSMESLSEIVASTYNNFLYRDGSHLYVTTAVLLQKMESEVKRTLPDRQRFIKHCMRLGNCLVMSWNVLQAPLVDFDPRIRASIAAIGELLSYSMNVVFSKFKVSRTCPNNWQSTFFRRDPIKHRDIIGPRELMLANGWCPSDISRSISKFKSIQMLHFLSMMSRANPPRDHQHCNDVECSVYQIKKGYKLSHVNSQCSCLPLAVDDLAIISILHEEDTIPLLRFTGNLDDIKIEILPSSHDIPYIAISHVWADGLGNQTANSLSRCQLIHLRNLVKAIADPGELGDNSSPLIWIDTLCCPIGSTEAKRKAIEKIRNVYQHARHVLVLDASIQSYECQDMEVVEQLARIFTSGWFRRLWTLQEGALAESLYFQFADRAVSLEALRNQIEQLSSDLRCLILMLDFTDEYLRIQAFFHAHRFGRPGPDLHLLNSALQHRSVSVASDEPVCIGTLMSLDVRQIVSDEVQEDERMTIVWKLLAEQKGGLPSQMIFFADAKIIKPGWRWAPASLLTITQQLHSTDTRIIRWSDKQLGQPTPYGLRVQFPGFRLALNNIDDGRPHQPWRKVQQLPESSLIFHDTQTGRWYMLIDQAFALMAKNYNDDGGEFHNTYEKFSLQDLLLTDNCYIIEETNGGGIIATLSSANETTNATESLHGLPVRTRRHIIVRPANHAQSIIYSTIRDLAYRLRNNNLTDKLLRVKDIESQQYQTFLDELKGKMKGIVAEALLQNQALGEAVDAFWGRELRDMIWVLVGDWYYHDFVGTRMPEGQIWYID